MFSLLILPLLGLQEPAPVAEPDVTETVEVSAAEIAADLHTRLKKVQASKAYAFKWTSTGSGGGGRNESVEPSEWTGIFQTGKPLFLKRGDLQLARQGERMATAKGEEGKWKAVSMPTRGQRGQGGRGGQGGQGGEAGERGERGQRGEAGQGGQRGQGGVGNGGGADRQQMRMLFEAQSIQPPHELLAVLEGLTQMDKLERSSTLGLVSFQVPLTHEGGMRFAMGGGMRAMPNSDDVEIVGGGMARLIFAADGKSMELRIDAEVAGFFRDREFSRANKLVVRAHQFDEAKFEVPAELKSALAKKPSAEEEF